MSTIQLAEHRSAIKNVGRDLLQVCGIEFPKISEVQRQICGAFLFGMVFVHGKSHQLPPPEVHALAITTLQDILKYSPEQAGAFSNRLIQASISHDPKDTMNAIIHRGIDGHRQLTTNHHDDLHLNLRGVFNVLNVPYVA